MYISDNNKPLLITEIVTKPINMMNKNEKNDGLKVVKEQKFVGEAFPLDPLSWCSRQQWPLNLHDTDAKRSV